MPFLLRCIIYFLAVCVLLSSCATRGAYYHSLNSLVSQGKYADAAQLAEKSRDAVYGDKNALLYYLDRGFLLHVSGDYQESNNAFEEAKKIADQYFTKSLATEASTLLVSDNMRPYYGEDFERAMINIFAALNYAFLGQDSEALVEARQVDHYLTTLQVNYGHKNRYTEDAFARYLMGMLYENEGQVNDAFISYRKALEAYQSYEKAYGVPVPPELVGDALRTAQRLGFRDEIVDIKKQWPNVFPRVLPAGEGEVVVLNYNGFSPEKVDDFIEISFGKGWLYAKGIQARSEEQQQVEQAGAIARAIASDEQVRIAFPQYIPVMYHIHGMEVSVSSVTATGGIVENIGGIAMKNLEDRITRVRVKAIARGVIKYALARNIGMKVEEKSGETTGWIVKKLLMTASAATELSDKRSWRSLPDTIVMARLILGEGSHDLRVSFKNADGTEMDTETVPNVVVRPGKRTFVTVRSAR